MKVVERTRKEKISYKNILGGVFVNGVVGSGVDVMITIFCDFCQFSAKNWRFLKNQCYESKTPIFRNIFRRKYF
jgi:hypothetical protein